ncbi:serine/threonine-protein kinase [Streptomyces sp. TRM70350]|uniref:serine/threonine-protein kinase n=1 Tax=Streptomyces sp. TRM70350 TaxID=2856165 RepID=UPI001C4661FB|nr:serine/threonine-protein kinase [Streptomyces sp. TRM70350]MBV7699007.1 protein kinase [Streptomyces sp. TRM70350]
MTGRPHAVQVPAGYRVGRWEVREPIASGAFGTVYAARAASGNGAPPRRVALKFLPTGTHTPRQLAHLRDLAEREVELLKRLRAPRLVRMYEALTVDDPGHPELDGATVLVLERAQGSLDTLLSLRPATGAVSALLVQVCEGLDQLHRAGWVHGDLKPANVLLMDDGTIRLADFNTAAELDGTHAYAAAFATPDYTPPELLWPEISPRGFQIRPTADIWAFGILAHLALAGTHPLPGATPAARRDAAVRHARGAEELRLSAELPPAWRQIIADCLARTHEERAAHDTAALLRRVAQAAGTARSPRLPRLRSRPRGRLMLATTTATVLLTALTLGVRALVGDGGSPGPGLQAETAADASPTTTGVSATATGYDRCPPGHICFFTEPAGQGDMCDWWGDDVDWIQGENSCDWAGRADARSVFNNGLDTDAGEQFVDVVYYGQRALRAREGCVEVGTKRDLPAGVRPLSHMWAENC